MLHAIEDNPFRIGRGEVSAALEEDEGARQAEARLRRFMEHRLWPAVRGEALVRRGDAVGAIVEAAREIEADLVVVGRRRRRGWDRLLSRSRLRQIVRQAACPVLTIPDSFAVMHGCDLAGGAAAVGRRVLAPVDGSEDSEAVLRWGAALAKAARGTLVVFHVAGLSREGQGSQGGGGEEFQAQTAEALEQRVWAWAKGIAPWAVRLEALRERGIAAAEVLAAMAVRERCDAIVVSSHAVGCWRRMLGGCLAEQLAVAGSSAVLCLPARGVKVAENRARGSWRGGEIGERGETPGEPGRAQCTASAH